MPPTVPSKISCSWKTWAKVYGSEKVNSRPSTSSSQSTESKVFSEKLDGIYRSTELSINFISVCLGKDNKIHSADENIFTDTPEGMFMVNCLLSVNRYPADNIRPLLKGVDNDGLFSVEGFGGRYVAMRERIKRVLER
tara:strand:+ start:298 stop:711 length:414 start_codon:yes stop_codon:yes gene_type:complete